MSSETIKEFLVALGFKTDEVKLKKFTDGIGVATKHVFELGAAVEGIALTIGLGVSKFAANLEQLYFSSMRTASSATALKSWGRAAEDFGVSADEALSSVEALSLFMKNYGGEGQVGSLFGIKTRDAKGNMLGGQDIKQEIAESMQQRHMSLQKALQFGGMVGLGPAEIQAMMKPEFLDRFNTLQNRLTKAGFPEAARHAHAFMMSLRDLGDQLVIIGTRVEDALQKKLGWSLQSIVDWLAQNQAWIISQVTAIASWFVDSFNTILNWTIAHWPEIKRIVSEALAGIKTAYEIVAPALKWLFEQFVSLDHATDGWSTKVIALTVALNWFTGGAATAGVWADGGGVFPVRGRHRRSRRGGYRTRGAIRQSIREQLARTNRRSVQRLDL
jgi:hypothetical protein